jgi:hypothetical protein
MNVRARHGRLSAILIIGFAAISACQQSEQSSPAPVSTAEPTLAGPMPTPAPTVPLVIVPHARPTWVADLEGQLECDGAMSSLGQEVPDEIGPFDPAPTPQRALESLLEVGMYAWLPATGFDMHVVGRWARYDYRIEGDLKAVVVSTNHFPEVPDELGWEIVGLRACDPSEFEPAHGLTDETTLWLDADGSLVRADRIFTRLGPEHCGWQDVTFLHFEEEQYLRDVEGVLDGKTTRPFQVFAALPADAVDTGLHTDELHLFTVPDGSVVYVRSKDGTIERWGRVTDDIGCA